MDSSLVAAYVASILFRTNTWQAIVNLIRNAFAEPILPGFAKEVSQSEKEKWAGSGAPLLVLRKPPPDDRESCLRPRLYPGDVCSDG